jgi:adenine deaminase
VTYPAASEPADLNGVGLRTRAVAAARGDAPFDILIVNGTSWSIW